MQPPVVVHGRVADVDERRVDRQVGGGDLAALAVLDAGEVGRQHDLVAVLGEDGLRLLDELLQLARPDELHRRRADVHAGRGQHDVGDQAGGEHRVDDAVPPARRPSSGTPPGSWCRRARRRTAGPAPRAGARGWRTPSRTAGPWPTAAAARSRPAWAASGARRRRRRRRTGRRAAPACAPPASSPGPRARGSSLRSNSVSSSPQKRTLSSSRTSPSASRPTASRAAGPQTSSMNATSRPVSSLITAACGSVEA